MIKYRLVCDEEHIFDVWFSHSKDYDIQVKNNLIECPLCYSSNVRKTPMIPVVLKKQKPPEIQAKNPEIQGESIEKIVKKVREHIEGNYEYVGDQFAHEARSMYYGEQKKRAVYGEINSEEAKDLTEEGIDIKILPDIFDKKSNKKLN